MAEAFEGLTGFFCHVVDDIVIYDKDKASHIAHVQQFLQCCQDRQISLNRDKCNFGQTEVTTGYRIDSSITKAVSDFPTPANHTDLQSYFGLANQLSSSTDAVSKLLLPMRRLLSSKHDFLWTEEHSQAFTEAKAKLVEVPTLAYLSLAKETRLCTDAADKALGLFCNNY